MSTQNTFSLLLPVDYKYPSLESANYIHVLKLIKAALSFDANFLSGSKVSKFLPPVSRSNYVDQFSFPEAHYDLWDGGTWLRASEFQSSLTRHWLAPHKSLQRNNFHSFGFKFFFSHIFTVFLLFSSLAEFSTFNEIQLWRREKLSRNDEDENCVVEFDVLIEQWRQTKNVWNFTQYTRQWKHSNRRKYSAIVHSTWLALDKVRWFRSLSVSS